MTAFANQVSPNAASTALANQPSSKRRLLLARDRIGKKPLHYALSKGRLLFGSETKTILAVEPELAELDSDALLQYFYFGYIPDPATAFIPIQKLPPGHVLKLKAEFGSTCRTTSPPRTSNSRPAKIMSPWSI